MSIATRLFWIVCLHVTLYTSAFAIAESESNDWCWQADSVSLSDTVTGSVKNSGGFTADFSDIFTFQGNGQVSIVITASKSISARLDRYYCNVSLLDQGSGTTVTLNATLTAGVNYYLSLAPVGSGLIDYEIALGASCTNFRVDDDQNECSDACYTTISDALSAAAANQEILVCDGTYNENLVVTKSGITLKGESGNRANVIIQNSATQPTVSLNAVDGVTLDTLSITNTVSRDAVSISSYSQNIVLKNLLLDSGRDALHTSGGNGHLELYDSVLNAGDDGIDITGQLNGGLILSGVGVSATDQGLSSNGELNGGVTFSNIDITAGSNGISLYQNINGIVSVDGVNITAGGVGLLFNNQLNGATTLQNMSISADSQAIFFAHNINADLSVSDSQLASTNSRGIYVGDNAYRAFTLSRISVNAKNEGIYFPYGKQIAPVISDSNITSSDSDTIFTRSQSWTTFTLSNSCMTTQNSGHYALNHYINGTNSHINGNCFYATATSELARAQRSGNDFLGNYWDGNSGNYTQNNISDTAPLASCALGCGGDVPLSLVAEYRLDSCSWNGTTGEVVDETGNYSGQTVNGTYVDTQGVINHAGGFDGSDDYIELPGFPDLLDNFTIMSWFQTRDRTEAGQRVFIDDENNAVAQSGYGISIADGGAGRVRFYDRSQSNYGIIDSDAVIQNNTWYAAVAVNDATHAMRHLYVYDANGNLLDHKTRAIDALRSANSGMASIGGETDSGETYNRFFGLIDEVKIFESALTHSQLESVLAHDRNGENYDGTSRATFTCNPAVEWRFDECEYDGSVDEVLDSTGNGYHAQTFNGVASDDVAQIERSAYFDGVDDYVGQSNLYDLLKGTASLSFWIKTTQKGKSNIPYNATGIAGIEQSGGEDDIFWGWIDRSGRICVTAKGNAHDVTSSHRINDNSWHHIVLTRDHVSGALQIFVDGGLSGSGTHPSGEIGTAFTHLGMIEDTGTSPQYFEGYLDEVKIFSSVLSAARVSAIYTNELSKNNYDGSTRTPIECGALPQTQYAMDAWDVFRDINDRNISTKIAAQPFMLTLASLNETNDDYQEFNGTVCSAIVGAVPKIWVKSTFADTNVTTVMHQVNNAIQDARVDIRWWKDADATSVTCSDNSDDNRTLSSDNFALRPESFTCNIPISPLTAEHNYSVNAVATQYGVLAATPDYNTTAVSISATKYMNNSEANGSLAGTFSISGLSTFENGTATGNLGFSDVGIIGIDFNDSTWAAVDSDDTPESNRTIYTECNRTFSADHFNVLLTLPIMENNSTFTYLSNDLNMSAWVRNLNVTFRAQGELGATLLNYQEPQSLYFAQNVDVTPTLIIPNTPYGDGVVTLDLPLTQTDTNLSFSQGVADINYSDVRFNYSRAFDTPRAPFLIDGADGNFSVSIHETATPTISGSTDTILDENATFYFGRLHPKDVKSSEDPATTSIEIEVYDNTASNFVQNFRQNSLYWYRHANHIDDTSGDALSIHPRATTMLDATASFSESDITIANPNTGSIGVSIIKHNGRHYLHVKTQPWLWYAPDGFGNAYDDTAGSTCLEHPCSLYTSQDDAHAPDISSGTFEGSDVAKPDRGDYTKGLKVFR